MTDDGPLMTAALARMPGSVVVIRNPRVVIMSPVEVERVTALASTAKNAPTLLGVMDSREGRMITPANRTEKIKEGAD